MPLPLAVFSMNSLMLHVNICCTNLAVEFTVGTSVDYLFAATEIHTQNFWNMHFLSL
jgi:hypothetical protein